MNFKKKTSLILVAIFILIVGTGFAIYTNQTNNRVDSTEEGNQIKSDVLTQVSLAFDIDKEHYYVCDIETLNDKLAELYKDDENISKLIYEEYYNEKYEKASPTVILINKDLKDVILGFINKNNEKVSSTIFQGSNGEWETSVASKK
ncbi:hypothetical protein HQN87_07635 [Paenibacillus tritici]|uniref:DUF4878 domain-containing protein n=1 Tax=Paenibacillus tritici TaxID=1873425 RepID=A0ABX2DL64_9BACL|nr:hypothetical protein [Paenibacillus tritici]NQX45200.1 hypothetical protein [Paenibacillus tritici]